jgi:hypothetical protein
MRIRRARASGDFDGTGARKSDSGVETFDHDRLDLAGTAPPEGSRCIIFWRPKTGDPLREGRKFDHDKSVKFIWAFHDLKTPAASEHLAAVLRENRGKRVGVFLIFDGIDDA